MTPKLSNYERLDKQLDGKLPFERENPKQGESKYYYIDPRGRNRDFTLLSKAKTIDVPSKYTPNPAPQEEMLAEAQKHPEKFYIWRTVKDERVRDAHAEREGCIFSWEDAPEGGHPGEDYNCRCTAEAYGKCEYLHPLNQKRILFRIHKSELRQLRQKQLN